MNGAAPISSESHRTLRKQPRQTWEKYSITSENPCSASTLILKKHREKIVGVGGAGYEYKQKKMKDKE